jgi:hypothetical protein
VGSGINANEELTTIALFIRRIKVNRMHLAILFIVILLLNKG